jgi:hypothetical protein
LTFDPNRGQQKARLKALSVKDSAREIPLRAYRPLNFSQY